MKATAPHVADPAICAVLSGYDAGTRDVLLAIRNVIYAAAEDVPDVGPLIETLKWGQLSYLPERGRFGTTVRLDKPSDEDHVAGVYFHCQTRLIDEFRERYPDTFTYVGNRSIQLSSGWEKDRPPLQHCISLALTYHLWKN